MPKLPKQRRTVRSRAAALAASFHPSASEERLRKQIRALAWVCDSIDDGIVIVNAAGKVLLKNPAAARILGTEPVETDLWLPDGSAPYQADSLPLARALRGESVERAEILVRNPPQGEPAWISAGATPLRDRAGALRGAVMVFRDTTERKGAERDRARLLEAERRARRKAERVVARQREVEERLKLLLDASGFLLGSLQLSGMLPAILDLAAQMIAVDAYAVWRQDQRFGEWRVAASSGLSAEYQKAAIQSLSHMAMPDEPMVFEDVELDSLLAGRRELYRVEGIRSILAVPMRIHGLNSGSITFYSRTPRKFEQVEIRSACALSNLAAAAIGSAELYQQQTRMRAEAEEAEQRSAFLAEATTLLGSTLDYEATLAQVARLAVPHMADWCVVYMYEPDASIRQLAVAHADPSKVEWARELSRRYPPNPNAPRGVFHVLRTGEAEMVGEMSDAMLVESAQDPKHLEILRQAGFTSYMCVPMMARGRTMGAIAFVSAESGRRFGAADLALAQHLGRRAGLAIDNALLFAAAQRERQAAEASLEASRRSEARFKRLLESGIIGIFLGELDTITEANDRFLEMIGYTREDLASGRIHLSAIGAPEYADIDGRASEELLLRGAFTPYEKEYIRSDGTRLPALVGGALLEGVPQFTWVCFALDLTERQRLEQRLRDSQKLESIGLLAGGVAHDFNNLLTGIMGNASLALDDLPPESKLRTVLGNVVRASERAAHLTRQLLAYSGRGRFVIQPLNLSELVSEIGTLLAMSIPKKVHLRLDLQEDLPPVEADSSQLQQLIMNLVLNGAEAIGESVGTVLVTTGVEEVDHNYIQTAPVVGEIAPGWYTCLEVHDTGCGMDDETKARIFDPFFSTKFTGRGLGLAAALGIVRSHKGDIRVSSSPGRGSTFKVLLPVATVARAEERAALPSPEELRGSGTVLLADDEEVVVRAATATLERYGYQVLVARDGLEAVDLFRQAADQVALVLLDVTMPRLSGDEVFAELQKIRPGVRVIVSSGYNETDAVGRFTGSGVAGFIQKPYTSTQLAETVKKALDGTLGLASAV